MADPSHPATDEGRGEQPASKRNDPVQRAGRLGRRVATAVYLVGLVYIIAVGFATVIPQVFWPSPATAAAAPEGDCSTALGTLEDALLEETGRRGGRRLAEPLEPFFRSWDDRYFALGARCSEARGYEDLAKLRYRLETTMRRFHREDGALIQKVDRALDRENSR